MKWGAALGGPEKLEVAFKALEPQLKREHQVQLRQLDNQRAEAERQHAARQAEAERRHAARQAEAERRRNHTYRMSGLISGVLLSLSMLAGGVMIAPEQPWLAAALCGPSLLALVKVFVLQRSDRGDMKGVTRASQDAAAASAPPSPPP
ncbi:hypothetical protein C9F11_03130 [Streptomyces sp. YIM 121038]|uniref:hypothetical protein n=1 Tax=Streptomyces sp. YIM 121038 TaxID=2136401 RepID=UPI0011641F9D|nr:hypothetical protein [Streptomyces sp. YIM 121038]QCX74329.1 hypothetical protein C9F11_03130 [Streptomyces sp. YIM 121038]